MNAIDILNWIFQDWWHYLGTLLLVAAFNLVSITIKHNDRNR